jgi:ribosomal protein S18 acetylase RimI-like enzyme
MIIRPLVAADLNSLQAISRQTFSETFADTNTEDNLIKYLDSAYALNKLSLEFNNPDSKFYFAEIAGQVVGYLKVNFGAAQTELNDSRSLEIERIYVLKEFHGAKVGQALYQKALEVAKEYSVNYLWLGVWEENHRALSFYKKNGFVEFDKHLFKLGEDVQTDLMMKLVL